MAIIKSYSTAAPSPLKLRMPLQHEGENFPKCRQLSSRSHLVSSCPVSKVFQSEHDFVARAGLSKCEACIHQKWLDLQVTKSGPLSCLLTLFSSSQVTNYIQRTNSCGHLYDLPIRILVERKNAEHCQNLSANIPASHCFSIFIFTRPTHPPPVTPEQRLR